MPKIIQMLEIRYKITDIFEYSLPENLNFKKRLKTPKNSKCQKTVKLF